MSFAQHGTRFQSAAAIAAVLIAMIALPAPASATSVHVTGTAVPFVTYDDRRDGWQSTDWAFSTSTVETNHGMGELAMSGNVVSGWCGSLHESSMSGELRHLTASDEIVTWSLTDVVWTEGGSLVPYAGVMTGTATQIAGPNPGAQGQFHAQFTRVAWLLCNGTGPLTFAIVGE
jgi:hypothetical protein